MSQSVRKAMQILIQLGYGPAGLDQLASTLDVHKTTVLRLLRTLSEEHLVFRDGSNRYHLGARVHELSSRGLEQREIRGIAVPHLIDFNRAHGRTTHLSELIGTEIVYIDKLESHDHLRMASRIGLRAPAHSTAAGKVLLADLPPDELAAIMAELTFPRITPNTITDRAGFLAELAAVRERGWASDQEENEPSINCIGAAVRGASGRAMAAVSISVPDIVTGFDELLGLLPALLEVSERISLDCGWRPPATATPGATADITTDPKGLPT